MKRPNFDGKEIDADLLTPFSEKERGRGRPKDISDDRLRHRLLELNFLLEENWGLIGWELSRAKSPADVRSAFNVITGFDVPVLDLYRREPTLPAGAKELRDLRKELVTARVQSRRDYEALAAAREQYDRAGSAIAQARDRKSRELVEALKPELAQKLEKANKDFETSRNQLEEMTSHFERQEAGFAQSQVVSIVRSGRHAFTPLSLAKGMAGLPYISARVSSLRCASLAENLVPGFSYQAFKAIQRVFAPPIPNLADGIEQMRAYALRGKKRPPPHIADIQKNWYFLKCAIEATYWSGPHLRGSLHYRIHAEYKRRFSVQSSSDVLLAQTQQL